MKELILEEMQIIENEGATEMVAPLNEMQQKAAIEQQESIEQNDAKSVNTGLFSIKPASQWLDDASKLPTPNMLFSELWFENELCFLFSTTNAGKSILAVQIADSISRGVPIKGFELEAQAQPVLYFDFELSKKQFQKRYSENFKNHYPFDDNLERAEIDPNKEMPEGVSNFENYLCTSLATAIVKKNAKVVIIDNLTFLRSGTETAKDAIPLIKGLKALKDEHQLSILVLGHTPKRDATQPIDKNDLAGSIMLMNFCDSSFAIGTSAKDKNLRYIKQIKARGSEMVYDTENVAICEIVKPTNFLHFEFVEIGAESEHLKLRSKKDKTKLVAEAKQLHSEGKSFRQIAAELGISKSSAENYVKQ